MIYDSTGKPTQPSIKPVLPMPRAVYNELLSGLDELDDAYGKTAESVNARIWLHKLARNWPALIEHGHNEAIVKHDEP